MHPRLEAARLQTRRQFLKRCPTGLGAVALAGILGDRLGAKTPVADTPGSPLAPKAPHFAPKAKRVIYLHMSGAPPQHELFDYKPKLNEHHLKPCPDELLKNARFPFIKGHPKLLGSPYKFAQHGKSGSWVS